MSEVLTTPDVKRLTKPPTRWRNWYRAGPLGFNGCCGECGLTGIRIPPGEAFRNHCRSHPSKEIAETRAQDQMGQWSTRKGLTCRYIGAFPEGERPA